MTGTSLIHRPFQCRKIGTCIARNRRRRDFRHARMIHHHRARRSRLRPGRSKAHPLQRSKTRLRPTIRSMTRSGRHYRRRRVRGRWLRGQGPAARCAVSVSSSGLAQAQALPGRAGSKLPPRRSGRHEERPRPRLNSVRPYRRALSFARRALSLLEDLQVEAGEGTETSAWPSSPLVMSPVGATEGKESSLLSLPSVRQQRQPRPFA